MTVYADVIFLYNFLIDWILIWTTAYVLKVSVRRHRIVLGAGLGALYTFIVFLPSLSVLYTFLGKTGLSAAIILCVFGYQRMRVFLERLLMFYLVSFVIGGGLLGINYMLQSESAILSGIVLTNSGGFGTTVTWIFIVISFPIIWWLTGQGVKQLKEKQRRHSLYGDVTVQLAGATIQCKGLMDTGNHLYEPITRIPVVIVEVELLKGYLPDSLYEAIKQQRDFSTDLSFMEIDDFWLARTRIIPYRSVSRGMDLLLALRPDTIKISFSQDIFVSSRVLIGLNPVPLASDGSFQAILHPQLTQEEYLIQSAPHTIPKEAI